MSAPDQHVLFLNYQGSFPAPFLVNDISRQSAPDFIPRFNTGGQGLQDSDLMHTDEISFDGGMFQPYYVDSNKVNYLQGLIDPPTGKIYPAFPRPVQGFDSYIGTDQSFTAKADTYYGAYVAQRRGSTNKLYHIASSGAFTTIALPAAISGSAAPITSLVFWKKYLFVAGETSSSTYFNLHRYNIDTGTWQDVSGYGVYWFELRNSLYHINRSSMIYLGSNLEAAAAATWTAVKSVGPTSQATDLPRGVVDFNGAAWIAKASGLYRFDGVDVVKILDMPINNLTLFNGALYFNIHNLLYRFDGSTLEKLQDFSADSSTIQALGATTNHLAIATIRTDTTHYSTFSSTNNYVVHYYDGASFFVAATYNDTTNSGDIDLFFTSGTTLYVTKRSTATSTNKSYMMSIGSYRSDFGLQRNIYVITSDLDNNLPNISKTLHGVRVMFEELGTNDSIEVQASFYRDGNWTSRSNLGTINSSSVDTSGNQENFLDLVSSSVNRRYEKLRLYIKVTAAADSEITLRSIGYDYLIVPKRRYRWVLDIAPSSDSITDNQNAIPSPVSTRVYSNNVHTDRILQYFHDENLFYFCGPDYATTTTSYTSSDLEFTLSGSLPYWSFYYDSSAARPYLVIESDNFSGGYEVLRISSASILNGGIMTVTVRERDFVTDPAAIASGAKVYLAHRATITRLLNDRISLDANNRVNDGLHSELEHHWKLEITQAE